MRHRIAVAALLAAFVYACDTPGPTVPQQLDVQLSVVAGDGQSGPVGRELPDPLVVRVTTKHAGNQGVPNQLVNFRVVTGGGTVFAGAALTDAHGYAQDYWTLGSEAGEQTLEVRAVNPSTGEKLVFAAFTALGLVPTDEVCNGIDDDLDGDIDEDLAYCIDGTAAPNTDGANCLPFWFDVNGLVEDGCEATVADQWEPNDTFADAVHTGDIDLAFGRTLDANFHHPAVDAHDWYAVRAVDRHSAVCVPGTVEDFTLPVTLRDVPAGSNYDLFVYDEHGTLLGSSENAGTALDFVTLGLSGICGLEDQFLIFAEVRFISGAATQSSYELEFQFLQF